MQHINPHKSPHSDKPNANLAASMGVNPNEAPDFLTKDYSKVMKAIDKKKGISNG